MADTVSIFNMALSAVGVGAEVQSETEDTTEANACRRFFTQCRDELLAEFTWPFATKTAELALVETDPTTEWSYSYRYPEDCLKVQRILGPSRNPSRDTRVPYLIRADGDGGLLLYTDWQDLENGTFLEYTYRNEDTSQWTLHFVKAMAYQLPTYIGSRESDGDPMKLADRSDTLAARSRAIAQSAAANEEQPEELPESEFIRARGGDETGLGTGNTFLGQFL